jgi:hypothetical protein
MALSDAYQGPRGRGAFNAPTNRAASVKAAPARRGFHFVPYPPKHTDQIIRYVDSLTEVVMPWVEEARLWAAENIFPAEVAEIRAQLAKAMQEKEWDGAAIGNALQLYFKWPVRAELVQRIHTWSCALHRTELAAYHARKSAAKA